MLINEVAKLCNLTKKAVEYYTEQKLICPSILENGYRDFSKKDVEILKHYQKYCDEPDKVRNSVRRKESIRFFYTASKEIFYEILDIVSKNDDEIFVFGCGYWGRELAKILDMKGIVIRGFLDNNSALWGMNIMDYVVEAPDKLYKLPEARVIIAIQGDTLGIEKQIVFLNRKVKCTSLEDIWRRMYCLCKENKN